MIKKKLGNTGLMVTPAGMGVLTVGRTQLNLPVSEGAELVKYALESGLNFLDTAQYYRTYPVIRRVLKGSSFDPVIASKSLVSGYGEMRYAVEEARRELDRDVIDIFMLHEVRSLSDWDNRRGAWECLQEAKEKGLIKAAGVSTHHVDIVEKAGTVKKIDVIFPLINFRGLGVRNGNGAGSREEMAAAIETASAAGKGVFAMKVFGGGNLSGSYREALDYVKNLPGVTSMMIGFGYRHEIDRIVEYAEGRLDPDYNPDMSKKRIRIDQGDCEGCGLCVERCPNRAIFRNANGLAEVNHRLCLTCGYCAPVCPVRAIIMF